MKTDARVRGKGFAGRHLNTLPVLSGSHCAGAVSVAPAQCDGVMTNSSPTLAQAKSAVNFSGLIVGMPWLKLGFGAGI